MNENNNNNLCTFHNKSLKYICLECNEEPICSDCYLQNQKHSGHKIIKTSDKNFKFEFINDIIPSLENIIKNKQIQLEEFKSKCNQLEIENNNNIYEIEGFYNNIIQQINNIQNNYINKIKNGNYDYSSFKDELDYLSKLYNNIYSFQEEIIDFPSTLSEPSNRLSNIITSPVENQKNIKKDLSTITQQLYNNDYREIIKNYEKQFKLLINNNNKELLSDEKFKSIIEILDFMINIFKCTEIKDKEKDVIFLMGPIGSGKSTLANYIKFNDNSFLLSKNKKYIQLSPEIKSNVKIGNGEGSTTLFPNLIETPFGTFIDWAGDFDNTDSTLAKFMISVIKQKILKNVRNVKIIFVTQQDSLGSCGQYGFSLRNSFDDSSKFLNFNIAHFQNSIGLVITEADSNENVKKECLRLLYTIKNSKNCFVSHKEIIDIILNGRFSTFSKPSNKLLNIYTPPAHNPNQRNELIEFINNIPLTEVSKYVDSFKESIPNEIVEDMNKVFEIFLIKTWDTINRLITIRTKPITIYSVEISQFYNFIKQLVTSNYENDLSKFLNILNFKNWFGIIETKELGNLNEKMNILYKLLNCGQTKYQCDWILKSNTKSYFETILNQVHEILIENVCKNNFEKFISNDQIKIIPSSIDLTNEFNELYKDYKYEKEIEQNNSKYYLDKKIPITEIEYYTEDVKITIDVPKTREIKYLDTVDKYTLVTKYRKETKWQWSGFRSRYVTQSFPYQEVVHSQVQEEITRTELFIEKEDYVQKVQKQRVKTVGHNTIKEFQLADYNNDKNNIQKEINKKRTNIIQQLSSFIIEKPHSFKVDPISNKDDIEQNYEDLKKLWQNVEYSLYALKYPNYSLENCDIKSI